MVTGVSTGSGRSRLERKQRHLDGAASRADADCSAEPEHAPLRGPAEREFGCTPQSARGERWRLGAIENGRDDVRRQKDRKSVVSGKSVSVRLGLGGSRNSKQKKIR